MISIIFEHPDRDFFIKAKTTVKPKNNPVTPEDKQAVTDEINKIADFIEHKINENIETWLLEFTDIEKKLNR